MLESANHILPPKGFYKGNRVRLVNALKDKLGCSDNSFILLKGEVEETPYDEDQIYKFSQDNKFRWTTGCGQPLAHCLVSIATGECTIYTPKVEEFRKFWEFIMEIEDYTNNFEVEQSKELGTLESDLAEFKPDTIFILGGGINKYSGKGPLAPNFDWLSKFNVNNTDLYFIFNELLVRKTPDEQNLLREAARIGSSAHVFVMQNARPDMNESHIQTLFRFCTNIHGHKIETPYEETCAADKNASVLQYKMNNCKILDGQMVLLDAGTKVNGYCSDITTCFPINGKFTDRQKQIYDIVLRAHNEVRNYVKPGVSWQEAHCLAEMVILQGLLDIGLIRGGSLEDLWQKRISYYFLPHGLGHYVGTYAHDLLGDPEKEACQIEILCQTIRVYRVVEQDMVLTNEPGCYFIPLLLEKARNDNSIREHFDFDLINAYANEIKGVRIEGMMIIHADHAEELTKVPRTTEQIEKCMARQPWE